jgi:hypothetical protein
MPQNFECKELSVNPEASLPAKYCQRRTYTQNIAG